MNLVRGDNVLAPEVEMTPVDPRLTRVKLQAATIGWAIPFVPLVVLSATAWSDHPWTWVFPTVVLLCAIWYLALIPRRVRAYGYAELPHELVVGRGIMFRHLDVVPYGRMQQITVESGPLLARAGLAEVTLVTASAGTDASIPGVRREEAERLRQKLTVRAEANLEGL
ncbi:MAG: PH domain-containing protein [Ancrocorticia sp.]|jgi:membrane protein YdbS with pleckstrin-like domain|nr:PH domain-containing protein [Ancrocorticia sp.]MCI2001962.1 PH domain-containing protein [Ancrocorticia sp.]MCI2012399.1 PH domain-containing protein [Ancrocorticia sp.]MCI2029179.1 PH domain-containing protein [Ancrocorticia sp.]MCI2178002.1 PH domain-containing protein [Ancrocorticia sp.]